MLLSKEENIVDIYNYRNYNAMKTILIICLAPEVPCRQMLALHLSDLLSPAGEVSEYVIGGYLLEPCYYLCKINKPLFWLLWIPLSFSDEIWLLVWRTLLLEESVVLNFGWIPTQEGGLVHVGLQCNLNHTRSKPEHGGN